MLLSIVGKGDKERYVPLPNPVLQSPRRLWKTRRHPRWIFPNDSGKGHVPLRTLRRAFAAARREAGLSSSFTPHALRHGYATRLVENGVSIGTVQILLGHASIRSTAVYTHMTEPTQRKLRSLLDQIMADL